MYRRLVLRAAHRSGLWARRERDAALLRWHSTSGPAARRRRQLRSCQLFVLGTMTHARVSWCRCVGDVGCAGAVRPLVRGDGSCGARLSEEVDLREISSLEPHGGGWRIDHTLGKEEYGRRRNKEKLRIEGTVRTDRVVGAKEEERGESPPIPGGGWAITIVT